MTRLLKSVAKTYTPGTPGNPGSPGQPYMPARYISRMVTTCRWEPSSQADMDAYMSRLGYHRGYGGIYYNNLGKVFSGSIPSSKYVCTETRVLDYTPAQPYIAPTPPIPASPASVVYDYQLGWTGAAHSITPIAAGGKYTFKVPVSTVGAVVGLTRAARATGYDHILYGFHVTRGVVRIYESGAEVAYIGSYPNATLEVKRQKGVVTYSVNGSVVRVRPNAPDPLILQAILYSGNDSVQEASVTQLSEEGGSGGVAVDGSDWDQQNQFSGNVFPRMQAFGGTVGYAIADGFMDPMVSDSYQIILNHGAGSMSALSGIGSDGAYAQQVAANMPAMESFAEGGSDGAAPQYALAEGSMYSLGTSAYGMSGEIGSGDSVFMALDGISADRPYAGGRAYLPAMVSYAEEGLPQDQAIVLANGYPSVDMLATTLLFAVMDENLELTGLVSVGVVNGADVMANAGVTSIQALSMLLEAELLSLMSLRTDAVNPFGGSDLSVWALNMDMGGITRYSNYGFNSFAKVGQDYFGARPDGIYKLHGATDNGDSISSLIDFGVLDFGTSKRKSLPTVYAGVTSNGHITLKVVADGKTYLYRLDDKGEDLKTRRFKLGKGLNATHYRLTLISTAAFDVSDIEFFPIELSRRL